VGKTYKEFGIVLSHTRLKEVALDKGAAFSQYVESTLLHEFGHHLGLGHNTLSDCVMNEKIEKPDLIQEFTEFYTPMEFCDYELDQLQTIKATLK
jgi:predicted Zn-dependent protease